MKLASAVEFLGDSKRRIAMHKDEHKDSSTVPAQKLPTFVKL
ncbi:MAG: hypothetical protein ACK4OM_04740 [Alphaproteobacteria bacterium]